jgi:hypothetical protein
MRRSLPCERRRYGCRYWLNLNWWAYAGCPWREWTG